MTDNNKYNYWAAVAGDTVFGVGATKYEATEDAKHWYGAANAPYPEFELLPCSEAAFDELFEHGFNWEEIAVLEDRVISRAELEAM